jgi:hypothetical protein
LFEIIALEAGNVNIVRQATKHIEFQYGADGAIKNMDRKRPDHELFPRTQFGFQGDLITYQT